MSCTTTSIVGKQVRIERPLPGDHSVTQTIAGVVEWHSADLLNFRLTGWGHIGIGPNDSLEVAS